MGRISPSAFVLGVIIPLSFSAPVHAQAVRTWISGLGDDVNPCSRTAPCKTFAGAISKTSAGGVINCLDAGGYGNVSITKSITLDCTGIIGDILAAGVTGIIINIDSANGMIVRLRGLTINGTLNGVTGISITGTTTNDNAISIEECAIDGFTQFGAANTAKNGRLFIKNTVIRNNWGAAVGIAVPSGVSTVKATLDNVSTFDSNFGFTFGNGVKAVV